MVLRWDTGKARDRFGGIEIGIRVRLGTGLEVLRWDTGKVSDRFGGIEMGYG